jgi:uncharacterized protein (UPF0548 family)
VFRLTRPTADEIDHAIKEYSRLGAMRAEFLASQIGLKVATLPAGWTHDYSRTQFGRGLESFQAAIRAFEQWRQFDLGWVNVANPGAPIKVGQTIAVQVHALGLWSLNLSQIVDVTRNAHAFGFIYKTTPRHVEQGEERFLLTIDPGTGAVHYELEAASRPRYWFARLGYPVTRAFQHRFARESHGVFGKLSPVEE